MNDSSWRYLREIGIQTHTHILSYMVDYSSYYYNRSNRHTSIKQKEFVIRHVTHLSFDFQVEKRGEREEPLTYTCTNASVNVELWG